MPRINLRDHDQDFQPEEPEKSGSESTPPRLDEYDDGSGREAPWIVLAAVIVLIGVVIVALNQFHVIQLWGKKPARVVETLEPAAPPPAETSAAAAQETPPGPSVTETTPLPTEPSGGAAAAIPKGGTKGRSPKVRPSAETGGGSAAASPYAGQPAAGSYAVQISSWPAKGRADRIASRLGAEGFNAYVEQADVNGKTWYRVRVGKYGSAAEANAAVSSLKEKGYEGAILVK